MEYATTNNIGNHNGLGRKKAKAVKPTAFGVFQMDGTDKGCTGNKKGHEKVFARFHAPNGFLKTTFLPKLKMELPAVESKKTESQEKGFYTSLSRLSAYYNIHPMETRQFAYPYNITLSLWDTNKRLKKSVANFDGMEIKTEKGRTFLHTEERCRTGATLYYIPVLPLFLMLQDKNRRQTAILLTSVCAYLYHIADIPYFRQEESYLYWQYEMIKDWVEYDEENEHRVKDLANIQGSWLIGDLIEQKIYNLKNLSFFEKRLKAFKAMDGFDADCQKLAEQALSLYQKYPQESIFRNKGRGENDTWLDESDIITIDKYVSFWADSEDWLSETVAETVNNEFNEYCEVDEPTISKRFDGSALEGKNLDFEDQLFNLIDELIYLLNTYKKERNGNNRKF